MDKDLFGFVRKFSLSGRNVRVDDDAIDRLHHHYTVAILLVFTVVISAKQYMGTPLDCWIPQHFGKSWGPYAENYCWVKNTYFVKDRIPSDPNQRRDAEIGYYQWVPFVLALQALLFYLPTMVWRLCNWQTGINIQELVSSACSIPSLRKLEDRQQAANKVADILTKGVDLASYHKDAFIVRIKRTFFCLCGTQRVGTYLSGFYLFIKLLYLVNVIGQLFLLNSFLGTGGFFYGFTLLKDLTQGKEWRATGLFPRVTFCDFRIRAFGQQKVHSLQCVLPINLFNEKIYIFLWFYLFTVSIISIVNTIYWFYIILRRGKSVEFVSKLLKVANINSSTDREINDCINKNIRPDGIFILRLISRNASAAVASMVLKRLWNSPSRRTSDPEIKNDIQNTSI